jgi:hypothetical protein
VTCQGVPRISAAVMTHPSRLRQAQELRDRHPDLGLQIVTETDAGRGHSFQTARRAWQAVAPDATHHLVVQDDCLLCEGFAGLLLAAVAARPADALCFFTEWGSRTADALRLAALEGAAWTPALDIYVPTLAAVLPAAVARDFARSSADTAEPDDVALARWLDTHGVAALVSVPNLAQHMDVASLTGNGYQGPRRSACFGLPGEFSPAGPVARVPDWLPHMSYLRAESGCFTDPRLGESDLRVELTARFLAERFALASRPQAEFAEVTASMEAAGIVRESIGDVALLAVWLTGYALGVLRAERSATANTEPPAALAALALASLAPGGLRRFLAQPLLAQVEGPAASFVAEAVRRGAAAYRTLPRRTSPALRPLSSPT